MVRRKPHHGGPHVIKFEMRQLRRRNACVHGGLIFIKLLTLRLTVVREKRVAQNREQPGLKIRTRNKGLLVRPRFQQRFLHKVIGKVRNRRSASVQRLANLGSPLSTHRQNSGSLSLGPLLVLKLANKL